MTNNNPIGIFDSGLGGLTVFQELYNQRNNENYIYFADTLNLPYGTKSKPVLIQITSKILDFFQSKNVKAVVIACNTTSAAAYETLKNNYDFKIYPIIQSVAEKFSELPIKRIGVLATPATVNSHAYAREINKYNPNIEVFEEPCFDWVQIVENSDFNPVEAKQIIEEHLFKVLDYKVEKIILGCTHYPYLLDKLSTYAPREMFINPAPVFADAILKDLYLNELLSDYKEERVPEFYASSNPENFRSSSKFFCEFKEVKDINSFSL